MKLEDEKLIERSSGGVDNINNYLTSDELAMLQNDLYRLLDTIFTFLADDYKKDDLKVTGTAMYNSNNIILSHYQEVTLAWLRAEDEYYENDLSEYKINYVNPSVPKVYKAKDNTVISNNSTLDRPTSIRQLITDKSGNATESSIVYFTLRVEGQDKPIVENQLYRGQDISLKAINNDTTKYIITTYSSNGVKKSNTASYNVTINKPVKITMNLKQYRNIGDYEDMTKVQYAYPGETIILRDEYNSGNNKFAFWESNGNKVGAVSSSQLTTYEVPEGYQEITINAHYKGAINSIDLKVNSPVAGQELATTGKAVVDNVENDININWSNNETTSTVRGIADYNTSYTLGVKIPTSFILDDSITYAKTTKANIYNGDTKVGEGSVKYRASDGSLIVSFVYSKTQKESLQEQPANLPDVVLMEVPDNYNKHLPAKVSVKTETGTKMVNVSWKQDNTKTNTETEHNYIGTLDLDSLNINKGPFTNTITSRIYVDADYGKTKISSPVSNLNNGTYDGEQELVLSIIENADIYYTITDDGSNPAEPTNESTKYTSAIELEEGKTYKVKAVAYPKDTTNYKHSDVSEFNYIINQMYELTINR